MQDFRFDPADLAPGDGKAAALDVSTLEVRRVPGGDDPLFASAYAALWAQFGAAKELESAEVLVRRLAWPVGAMRYDLVLIYHEGALVAVRDHTAAARVEQVVVHLSHAWITPAWRRTGLAGWLRALPLQTARACGGGSITLVAEMEYADGVDESRDIRLKAYERAGFFKVDPRVVHYHQPDFRSAAMIDASGGPVPLPFQLIVRRVGREGERQVMGAEVRRLVEQLYSIYEREFRPQEMAVVRQQLACYPGDDELVALLPPTA